MDSKRDQASAFRALPLLWLSLAFLAGLLLASLLPAPWWLWFLLAASLAFSIAVFRKRLGWLPQFALAAACLLLLGATRYAGAQPIFAPTDLAYYNDSAGFVELRGLVAKPPVNQDSYVELRVEAEQLTFANGETRNVRGLVLAQVNFGEEWHYGDRILLRGELQTPTENADFSYRDYLARQGIYSQMPFAAAERLASGQGSPFWAAIYGLRQFGIQTLTKIYPAREAALLAGILLGDESGLSDSLKTAFNDTGTRHVIAISGFNISIIAGVFLTLFSRWLGVRKGAWLAAAAIGFYTLLVGADASVVRAAIMGIVALIALQLGRQAFALNTLAFSAALMALLNPLLIWDVGFQLSFAATLGILLYAEPMRLRAYQWIDTRFSKEWARRLSGSLNAYAFMTIAAQITTLPILLFYFQRLSLLSLPANLLILPAQPALMILGGASVLVGMIAAPLGQILAFFGWALAAYTIRLVEFFAALPWASQSFSTFTPILVFLYFAFLATLTFKSLRTYVFSLRLRPAFVSAGLAVGCLLIWNSALAAPDGNLQIVLLDVDGEALLIRTPAGRNLLVNGGSSARALADELGRQLPLGETVDWLLVAGQRREQIGGLQALSSLPAQQIAWAGSKNTNDFVADLYATVSSEGEVFDLQTGQSFDLGQGAKLKVLGVGERGAVLFLVWGSFSALLPVGLDFDLMDELKIGSLGQIDLLLLAHSSYAPLNPPSWLTSLAPQLVWVQVNDEEPSPETLAALNAATILRTDVNGWLRITTDGETMWTEAERATQ